jgi:hypothetical protein
MLHSSTQCCGSGMIYFGFGSTFQLVSDLDMAPDPDPVSDTT